MRDDPVHAPSLVGTGQVHADAEAGIDHLGRRHAKSAMDAFRMDWPWVLALAVLLAYILASLAGYLRL